MGYISMFNQCFTASFISIHLLKRYSVPEEKIGYCLAVMSIGYLLSCLLMSSFLQSISRRLKFLLCLPFSAVAYVLIGAPNWIGIPDSLPTLLVGLFILGFSQSMSFVPALPEAIDCTVERLGDHEEVHDSVSSLFTLMWSCGVLSGTLLGGLMYDRIGFESAIKVAIMLMILVTPLYV